MTIRVLFVDDQPLMHLAFETALEATSDIEVAGQAADGREAIELATRLQPDVVLMDIRMPLLDGIEATRIIKGLHPEMKVLILTTFELDEYVLEALREGASGFLLKDVRPKELIGAIRTVAKGDALLAPSVTRRLLDAVAGSLPHADGNTSVVLDDLTQTEIKVLTLVGKGYSNEEIAEELFVADTTVRTHIRHLLAKLGLRDRVQAVVLAYDTGLARPTSR